MLRDYYHLFDVPDQEEDIDTLNIGTVGRSGYLRKYHA